MLALGSAQEVIEQQIKVESNIREPVLHGQ
jgi:hypothetical protein